MVRIRCPIQTWPRRSRLSVPLRPASFGSVLATRGSEQNLFEMIDLSLHVPCSCSASRPAPDRFIQPTGFAAVADAPQDDVQTS
jgi:hypothetical protein